MLNTFKRFWADESGQGLTEYALILALISVGLLAVLVIFRNAIGNVFDDVANALQGVSPQSYAPQATT